MNSHNKVIKVTVCERVNTEDVERMKNRMKMPIVTYNKTVQVQKKTEKSM